MAQIGRAAATPAASAVSGGRATSGARNVASVNGAPIEALNAKLGTFLDDNAFSFDDFTKGKGSNRDGNPGEDNPIGRLRASTQAFAAFLEFESNPEQSALTQGIGVRTGTISPAINTYETNARVISGANIPLGHTLTMKL